MNVIVKDQDYGSEYISDQGYWEDLIHSQIIADSSNSSQILFLILRRLTFLVL